jgi:hypothetical protein
MASREKKSEARRGIDPRVLRQIEKSVAKRKAETEDKTWTMQEIVHDLATWGRANPDIFDPHQWATEQVIKWDEDRRPILDEDDLFPDDRVIPDGSGKRRYLVDATPRALISWISVETTHIQNQTAAYNRKISRAQEWLTKFDDPAYGRCKTLGDIWRKDGWKGPSTS